MKSGENAGQERIDSRAYARHGGNNDDRDESCDQTIFDCGGATCVNGESFHSRSRNIGSSGKSAAGMG